MFSKKVTQQKREGWGQGKNCFIFAGKDRFWTWVG